MGEGKFDYGNVMLGHEGNFVPLGKVEDAQIITAEDLPDGKTLGIDMTGFRFGTEMEFTAELQIENPLRLKLTLLGIPVVNVILCKNCAHRNTRQCQCKGFGDYDSCSRGVLRDNA